MGLKSKETQAEMASFSCMVEMKDTNDKQMKKKSRLGRHWLFKSFSSDIKLPLSIKDLHVLQVILLITPLHAPHNHQPTLLNHHGMTSPARVEAGQ